MTISVSARRRKLRYSSTKMIASVGYDQQQFGLARSELELARPGPIAGLGKLDLSNPDQGAISAHRLLSGIIPHWAAKRFIRSMRWRTVAQARGQLHRDGIIPLRWSTRRW